MRTKSAINLVSLLSLCVMSSFAAACRTTRYPSAVRNESNSALIVQVSEDPNSLMWNGVQRGSREAMQKLGQAPVPADDPAMLQMRAELLLVGRMSREAAANAERVLRRDMRNVAALKTLIKSALIERRSHAAIALCKVAADYAPQDAELLSFEGLAHYQLQNPVAAKILWTRSLVVDPVHIPALMNLGVLLFQNGHTRKAGAQFDRVLAVQPDHLDALSGSRLC